MGKHSTFCPGCGQPIIFQTMYRVIKEKGLEQKSVLGLDIGCSLLAWDLLPMNTFQTHHGRVVATMTGFKRARPDLLAVAYTGDGGAYAIGLQCLIYAAKRNDPVLVVVCNNAVYAMTGGQSAPTTFSGQKTDTAPSGNKETPFLGPELIRTVNEKAYIARTAMNNLKDLQEKITKAVDAQLAGNFSLVEVLSYCPVNWHTFGPKTNEYLEGMKKVFKLGEL